MSWLGAWEGASFGAWWGYSAEVQSTSGAPAGSKRRRRIQAQYKDRVYEFDTDAEARQFLLSLTQEYKPSRAERKKSKPGAILTPRVEFTIDDIPVQALDLSGWNPLDAIMAGEFEMLYAAVQRVLEDEEESLLLLM